jgi:hypothetical protein
MGDWWTGLDGDLQVFYLIGIIAGAILILQIILLAFGVGFDADVDVSDIDGDFDADVGFFSLRSITAFFFGFGWTGVIAIESGASTLWATLIALVVGLGMFVLVALVWQQFAKLGESGSLDYAHAVGVTGSVYLPIAANRSHPGKVEVMIQGRLAVVDAYTESDVDISSQTRVRVIATIDQSTVLVEPI